jgi:hypothetical protein
MTAAPVEPGPVVEVPVDPAEATRLREVALGLAAAGLTGMTQRGVDPSIVRDELYALIEAAIANTPRSAQTQIGPSEIGTPCDRQLAYRLVNTPTVTVKPPAWRATVGTAVHQWLAQTLEASNVATGVPRWLTETRVDVGEIADESITGSCDAYDLLSATVVDWKVVGPTSLRAYKANGPGAQYRTQVHIYGRGWQRMGLPVDNVAIFFLPSNGELRDGVFWSEPFYENLAISALQRATDIKRAADIVPADVLFSSLRTHPAHCGFCPWRNARSTTLSQSCPGHPGREIRKPDDLTALIGKRP